MQLRIENGAAFAALSSESRLSYNTLRPSLTVQTEQLTRPLRCRRSGSAKGPSSTVARIVPS